MILPLLIPGVGMGGGTAATVDPAKILRLQMSSEPTVLLKANCKSVINLKARSNTVLKFRMRQS